MSVRRHATVPASLPALVAGTCALLLAAGAPVAAAAQEAPRVRAVAETEDMTAAGTEGGLPPAPVATKDTPPVTPAPEDTPPVTPAPEDTPPVASAPEDTSSGPAAADESFPLTSTDDEREEALATLAGTTSADFYVPPAELPDGDGTLVRSEPMTFYVDPLRLVRYPAHATRIMYTSRSASGDPIAVTGTVLVPTARWTGPGERPVVGYAVGTQGIADECAPSRKLAVGQEYEGVVVSALLAAGYALVITDYEGLGTPGTHTYMVRASQAHAVLDALRAAAALPGTGTSPTAPTALVGYSQGGGASAAAAELAPTYAPEIPLVGAYAGAVPADLGDVADRIDGSLYSSFLLYAFAGQLAAYGMITDAHLDERGEAVLDALHTGCVVEGLLTQGFLDSSRLTRTGQHLSDLFRSDATLSAIAREQRIGEGRVPAVPVLLSHSLLDDVVPYRTGRALAERWCDQGATVQLHTSLSPGHVGGYVAGLPRLASFLTARFAGRAPVDSCWRL